MSREPLCRLDAQPWVIQPLRDFGSLPSSQEGSRAKVVASLHTVHLPHTSCWATVPVAANYQSIHINGRNQAALFGYSRMQLDGGPHSRHSENTSGRHLCRCRGSACSHRATAVWPSARHARCRRRRADQLVETGKQRRRLSQRIRHRLGRDAANPALGPRRRGWAQQARAGSAAISSNLARRAAYIQSRESCGADIVPSSPGYAHHSAKCSFISENAKQMCVARSAG